MQLAIEGDQTDRVIAVVRAHSVDQNSVAVARRRSFISCPIEASDVSPLVRQSSGVGFRDFEQAATAVQGAGGRSL
jgi:hypothetical protein